MELELENLLTTINRRFSGPESCMMQDMIVGKLDIDTDEIKNYLNRLIKYGGINLNYQNKEDRVDAKNYLNQFNEYIDNRNKKRD
ncbi:MAG: hypothetical protein ABI462_08190 [Ignavibacteria bacterium]